MANCRSHHFGAHDASPNPRSQLGQAIATSQSAANRSTNSGADVITATDSGVFKSLQARFLVRGKRPGD